MNLSSVTDSAGATSDLPFFGKALEIACEDKVSCALRAPGATRGLARDADGGRLQNL